MPEIDLTVIYLFVIVFAVGRTTLENKRKKMKNHYQNARIEVACACKHYLLNHVGGVLRWGGRCHRTHVEI